MWKLFLILGLSVPLLGASSCSTAQIPKWEGKIYAGRYQDQAMVRKQAGEIIRADSPEFNDLMGMKWKGPDGFEGFYKTYVLGCKEWKKKDQELITLEEAKFHLQQARSQSLEK